MYTCFYCGEEITDKKDMYFLGLDKPYINLLFHKEHYNIIKSNEVQYLAQNIDLVYNYYNKSNNKGKNDGNTRRK